jgi:hypothetical protein
MKRQIFPSERNELTSSKRNILNFASSPILLLFPDELIIAIMSFVNISSSLALVRTCKTLYTCYERYYESKTTVVLYDSQIPFTHYIDNVRALYDYMHQHGLVRLKLVPISDFQNDNYPMRVLCLNEMLNLPSGVNSTSVSNLIMVSSLEEKKPIMSFEKFANLKTLGLRNVSLNDDMRLMFSQLNLLEIISLYDCSNLSGYNLSNMFADCISLEKLQIIGCKYSHEKRLRPIILLPPKLKSFEIQRHLSFQIDASRCTHFKFL